MDIVKLVQDNGITLAVAIGAIIGGVYIIKFLLTFVLKEQKEKIDDLHKIIVGLIDANKKTQMILANLAGKMGVDIPE